jgi:hypothetical protein
MLAKLEMVFECGPSFLLKIHNLVTFIVSDSINGWILSFTQICVGVFDELTYAFVNRTGSSAMRAYI